MATTTRTAVYIDKDGNRTGVYHERRSGSRPPIVTACWEHPYDDRDKCETCAEARAK